MFGTCPKAIPRLGSDAIPKTEEGVAENARKSKAAWLRDAALVILPALVEAQKMASDPRTRGEVILKSVEAASMIYDKAEELARADAGPDKQREAGE